LRLDKGTETVVITTMHAFLRQHHGDMDPNSTIIYGPLTSNQVVQQMSNARLYPDFDNNINIL
jgi:hypothetical protein